MAKKSREKEARWRDILKRQAASGLSIRKFCEQEGVSEPSFYCWRRELAARDRKPAAQSRKSKPRARRRGNAEQFVPLTLIDSPATLEVVHPLGFQVRITGQVDADALRQVLDVLDERGRG